MKSASAELGFTFRTNAQGAVSIARAGREVMILRGGIAAKFLAKVEGASPDLVQQQCARVTGNYKRGNESSASKVRGAKG